MIRTVLVSFRGSELSPIVEILSDFIVAFALLFENCVCVRAAAFCCDCRTSEK
jgi:hypothetical protein